MRRPGLMIMAVMTALALALVAAGCDRGRGPGVATAGGARTASADPSAPAADEKERARQFARCMREHGIDLPDPDEDGPKLQEGAQVDKRRLTEAYEACRAFVPADEGKRQDLTPAEVEQLRQFARCIRDHGVPDWPDPEPDGSFGDDPAVVEAKNSPHMREALEACESLLPGNNEKGVKGG